MFRREKCSICVFADLLKSDRQADRQLTSIRSKDSYSNTRQEINDAVTRCPRPMYPRTFFFVDAPLV